MKLFGLDVICRWLVGIILFLVVDSIKFRNGFDPSGHCYAVILSQTMYLKPVMFLHQQADIKTFQSYKCAMFITAAIYIVTQVIVCYGITFTTYKFHLVSESIAGLLIGYMLCAIVYSRPICLHQKD